MFLLDTVEVVEVEKLIDLSTVDLTLVLDEVLGLVPYVLPATIGFIAFRKGWAFVKSALRGA